MPRKLTLNLDQLMQAGHPRSTRGTLHRRAIATLSLCILTAAHTGCMTAAAAFQPENIGGETIVITTTEADGESHERVLSPIDYDGRLFVAPAGRVRSPAGSPEPGATSPTRASSQNSA